VSVIVPARNEEVCLEACLRSLIGQAGVAFEIIVVDDASTDRTRQIAASFPQVRVVDARALPAGWSGKTNAMVCGEEHARGQWLLFTDADTVHLPDSLARALHEALDHGAALLSYSPVQEVHSFWEKAAMPVIFGELAGTYRPREVNDPASKTAAANGQYLLISREAYAAVGGFSAVATSLLEDVALARLVKGSGRRIFFRFGGDAVRTRMYRGFYELREGWTKNLALLFPAPLRLALLRLTEFGVIAASAVITVFEATQNRSSGAVFAAICFLIFYGLFMGRICKAHFPGDSTLLAVIGLPFFSYLLLRSAISHREGQVTWKGRRYGAAATSEEHDLAQTDAALSHH